MTKGWTDKARAASAAARATGLASGPKFSEYASEKLGSDKWVIGGTSAAKAHPDHKPVSQKAFTAIKEEYRKDHPEAHKAYFGIPLPEKTAKRVDKAADKALR